MRAVLVIGGVLSLSGGVAFLVEGETGWGVVILAFGVIDFILFAKSEKQDPNQRPPDQ